MDRAELFIHSPTDGHLERLQFLIITSQAAMNICVRGSAWTYAFNSLGNCLEVDCLNHFEVNI